MILTRRALADVAEARSWYDRQSPGLGAHFLDAVDHCMRRIDAEPTAFPLMVDAARRLNLQRFPYGVWYVVEPEPLVVGVLHHRRSLDRMRSRTP